MSATIPPAELVVVDLPDESPPGPLTTGELAAAVPWPGRDRYRRLWRGMYRHEDQVDDLRLRSFALARSRPDGVLRGRSAALMWGDDTAPEYSLPEIWLPVSRPSPPGREYRSGRLAAAAVTAVGGVRVTTPLRTCRDLAAELDLEDAVASVDRMCAHDPTLAGQLRTVADHPAAYDDPLGEVVALLDPRSVSTDETRARAVLVAAGFAGFGHGHLLRLGRARVDLPLADPALRCAVYVQPLDGERRTCDEPTARELRRAGWTLVMVRPDHAADLRLVPDPPAASGAGAEPGPGAEPALLSAPVAQVARVLVERWPATSVRAPFDVAPAADPHGMWA